MNRQQRRKIERFGIKVIPLNTMEAYSSDFIFMVNGDAALALNGPEDKIKKFMEFKFPDTMRQVKEQTDYNLKSPCTLFVTHNNETMKANIAHYEEGYNRAKAEGSFFNERLVHKP